ncbi:hypothetical protein ABEB36_007392 [Hypothenemus hampei]|uniref:Uncharacterized protein n=1 Tax=Hypothenemus hampei TaxID=57062 RepID=A0ABD1ETT5_HYPHA
MHVRKVTVIFVYLVSIMVSFVIADMESNKRIPGAAHAFQQMVRYGRSGNNKDNKIKIFPRADVFYLGPRYGKRSRELEDNVRNEQDDDESFPCIYTGVTNLYRCNMSRFTPRQHRM